MYEIWANYFFAKGFKKSPKVQKIANSSHTDRQAGSGNQAIKPNRQKDI